MEQCSPSPEEGTRCSIESLVRRACAGQIMELESKAEQLQTDLADRGGKKGKANSTNLPKNVAKHELSGFRGPVTHIAFNPVVPLVAASGEDGTVKVR